MKRLFVFGVLLNCLNTEANGQGNLVPNPSFEYFSSCPTNLYQLNLAVPWDNPINTTSDYFNPCNSVPAGIPQNTFGYESAQDSFAYAGFVPYVLPSISNNNYREYVETVLLDSLLAGKKYCVIFYISLADTSEYAVSNISAYLSPNGGGVNPTNYFNYNPQINNPFSDVIFQKDGWVKISGSFIANGNERYITIGNFMNDTFTNSVYLGSFANNPYSYYYLDNVSVIEIADCIAGTSSQICPSDSLQLGIVPVAGVTYSWQPTIGLSNANTSNPKASPSTTTTYTLTQIQCEDTTIATVTVTVKNDCDILPPLIIPTILKSEEKLSISGLQAGSKLEIVDMRGRKVFVSENYQNEFGGNDVAVGMYALRFTQPGGEVIKQKLCIVK